MVGNTIKFSVVSMIHSKFSNCPPENNFGQEKYLFGYDKEFIVWKYREGTHYICYDGSGLCALLMYQWNGYAQNIRTSMYFKHLVNKFLNFKFVFQSWILPLFQNQSSLLMTFSHFCQSHSYSSLVLPEKNAVLVTQRNRQISFKTRTNA